MLCYVMLWQQKHHRIGLFLMLHIHFRLISGLVLYSPHLGPKMIEAPFGMLLVAEAGKEIL